MGFVFFGEKEMNINHYYVCRLSHERMQRYLQEAGQHRLAKLAYPLEDKPHWVVVISKKIKDFAINLLNLHDRTSVSKTRVSSYTESSSR
jgi:hypothetical protein